MTSMTVGAANSVRVSRRSKVDRARAPATGLRRTAGMMAPPPVTRGRSASRSDGRRWGQDSGHGGGGQEESPIWQRIRIVAKANEPVWVVRNQGMIIPALISAGSGG